MTRNDSPAEGACSNEARRLFLKACGTSAIALIGGSAVPPIVRRALAAPPAWSTVPNQVWTVGTPVHLDLSNYCSDPDGDPLTYSLDRALPAGVTRNGSVISGTPTAPSSTQSYIATADDGSDSTPPDAPRDLRDR